RSWDLSSSPSVAVALPNLTVSPNIQAPRALHRSDHIANAKRRSRRQIVKLEIDACRLGVRAYKRQAIVGLQYKKVADQLLVYNLG
ncbi:MAG TPA: hypothetical protein VIF61_01885, partial [Methylocystis sp.]